jgi:hypothetical protein
VAVTAAYGLGLQKQVVGRLRLEGWLEESAEPTAEGVLAAEYLGRLGERSGAEFLLKVARTGPEGLRAGAADALRRLPGKGAAAAVRQLDGKGGR